MTNGDNELSILVRKARATKGLTTRQLADASGVNFKTVNRIETGRIERPHSSTLARLAPYLDLDLEELLRAVPMLEGAGE